ncbi:hypothetical protein [Sulfitobacter sp. M22]|uniref:hypothetical protein n=1 Tax=Sulfitobacter sp. M22 TaxID=2675332 RepID=UPI001F445F4E|nr:hypothetical protein [Sulfitobacter sp. M22]MCF7727112.1 hypothetical protein [Sulfitobacter sp. M22]
MSVKIEATIRRAHEALHEEFTFVEADVRGLLKEACEIQGWSFEDRLKSADSYAMKLMTGRYDDYQIDDFYACTIVVPNLKAVLEAIDFVKKSVVIIEEKPGAETHSWPTSFGFDSVRIYCKLPTSVNPKPYQRHSFEIQVKTLLEHAWAKATHDFSYKGDDVSWARERLAAQIKAVLDNVDLSINELERTANSEFLDKKNPAYEKLRRIITVLKSEFGTEDSPHTITDYKRLAEQVARLLDRLELEADDLITILSAEAELDRGKFTINLSPYSIILVSIAMQLPDKLRDKLTARPQNSRLGKIVIPHEVIELCEFDPTPFKRVKILRRN